MEGTELYGNAGPYTNEGGKGAFVESEGTFLGVDGTGCCESIWVSGCSLETDFYYIEWLT